MSDGLFTLRAERLIEEAIAAGEFDCLPGSGKPIPGAGTVDDDLWWVRAWMRADLVAGPCGSRTALLPEGDQ